jgi:hypothetical protein
MEIPPLLHSWLTMRAVTPPCLLLQHLEICLLNLPVMAQSLILALMPRLPVISVISCCQIKQLLQEKQRAEAREQRRFYRCI